MSHGNLSRAPGAGPPRVLHVIPPSPFGGAESVLVALARGSIASGRPVRVAALLADGDGGEFVTSLADAGVPVDAIRAGRRGYLAEIDALSRLLRRHAIEIVHTHIYRADLVGWMAARRCGVPVVATVHGYTGGPWRDALNQWIDRRLLRRFDGVVCVAETSRTLLQRAGCRPDRLHLVVNGLPAHEPVTRDEARRVLGLPDGVRVAGFVGRLRPEKGPDLYLEALAACPRSDLHGAMVGDGPLRDDVARRIVDLRLTDRVMLLGGIRGAGRLMRAFDCLVVSSRTEQAPMVVLEAMLAEVPVVAAAVGGIGNLLGDTGWVVPPGDVTAMAGVLAAVFGDPAAAAARARRARDRAHERFAMDRWLNELDAVYRRVIGPGAA